MSQPIHATFKSIEWKESPITADDETPRMTRASCKQEYTGGIVGTSQLEYLMVYNDGGAAHFVGMERIVGTVDGRKGSFALHHHGVFENGVARMRLTVVDGAGTGALETLRGGGQFESPHAAAYHVTLDCSFAEDRGV